jgi:hypothetical protein
MAMRRLALAAVILGAACSRGPRSAAEAVAGLRAALERGDAAAAFADLDEPTRWSIEAAHGYHQRALAAIEEGYPHADQAPPR